MREQVGEIQLLPLMGAELRKPGGLALAFAAIALSLITIFVLPEWEIGLQEFSAILILLTTYICLLYAASRTKFLQLNSRLSELELELSNSAISLPRVLRSMKNPTVDDQIILLLEGNSLFGQSMLVSIYYENEDRFEILIANGEVQNSQMNGMIQVAISDWINPHGEVKAKIWAGDRTPLANLRVRPAPTTQPRIPHVIDAALLQAVIASLQPQTRSDQDE